MILIDYNAIAIGNVVTQKMELEENLIRHMIFNSIRLYSSKFKRQYGDIVICSDGSNNWRKEVYPQYKIKRGESRDKSSMDWDELFRCTNLVLQEIKDNKLFPVVHIEGCEADDCIAQIAINTQEFGQYEPVMIISADKDFAQLQTMENVAQFSTMTKKFIKESNPRKFLAEHVLRGDASDGVPNVLSPDHCFAEGIRQTQLRQAKIDQLIEDPKALGEEVYRNYLRNKKMIDLTELPEVVKDRIIYNWEEQRNIKFKPNSLLNYFIKHRCKLLIESIGDF